MTEATVFDLRAFVEEVALENARSYLALQQTRPGDESLSSSYVQINIAMNIGQKCIERGLSYNKLDTFDRMEIAQQAMTSVGYPEFGRPRWWV